VICAGAKNALLLHFSHSDVVGQHLGISRSQERVVGISLQGVGGIGAPPKFANAPFFYWLAQGL
jgi:hypothetical protein